MSSLCLTALLTEHTFFKQKVFALFFLSATLLQLKDAIWGQDPTRKSVFCDLCYIDNLIRLSQGFIF